jgi:ferritin
MISQKMQDAINQQVNAEIYSAYLYLSMSAYAEDQNLPGFAHWLRRQHQEEMEHAFKLMQHLYDRGGRVLLKAIEAPTTEWKSITAVFENVLEHEQHVTALIHKLYDAAVAEKDTAAQIFLQWFVTEQVEEEASASSLVENLRRVGEKSGGFLWLDKDAGRRGDD